MTHKESGFGEHHEKKARHTGCLGGSFGVGYRNIERRQC